MNLNQSPSELRSCVKEEVDVLVSPSPTVRTVSVDVKQHLKKKKKKSLRRQLCFKLNKPHERTRRRLAAQTRPSVVPHEFHKRSAGRADKGTHAHFSLRPSLPVPACCLTVARFSSGEARGDHPSFDSGDPFNNDCTRLSAERTRGSH